MGISVMCFLSFNCKINSITIANTSLTPFFYKKIKTPDKTGNLEVTFSNSNQTQIFGLTSQFGLKNFKQLDKLI